MTVVSAQGGTCKHRRLPMGPCLQPLPGVPAEDLEGLAGVCQAARGARLHRRAGHASQLLKVLGQGPVPCNHIVQAFRVPTALLGCGILLAQRQPVQLLQQLGLPPLLRVQGPERSRCLVHLLFRSCQAI